MDIKVYKIYNPKIDKFIGGHGWSKPGKTWHNLGHIKTHLRSNLVNILPSIWEFRDIQRLGKKIESGRKSGWIYKECEIIELTHLGISRIPVVEILKQMKCKDMPETVYDKLIELYGPDFL